MRRPETLAANRRGAHPLVRGVFSAASPGADKLFKLFSRRRRARPRPRRRSPRRITRLRRNIRRIVYA